MSQATYALAVDLDGDEIFAASEAVTSHVVPAGQDFLHVARGLDPTRPLAPLAAGSAGFRLDDGPLRGNGSYAPGGTLSKGKGVRLRATFGGTTYDLMRGLLDGPHQDPTADRKNVDVTVLGTLSRLAGKQLSTGLYSSITTDVAIGHLLDAGGWPKNLAEYAADITGLVGAWPMGEASGDALDATANGNDGTVTIGAGARGATALDDGGDGCIEFDGADTKVEIADDAAIQDVFDGGGSVAFILDADSDGEASLARVVDKGVWDIHAHGEAGGLIALTFNHQFSGTNGNWETAVDIPIGTTVIGVLVYDADAVANNPTLYLWDGSAFSTRTVGDGLTETTAPTGTRTTDVGSALVIGNATASNRTFDGHIDEVRLYSAVLTAAQAAALVARALDAPRRLDVGKTTLAWWWMDNEDAMFGAHGLSALLSTEGPGAAIYEDGTGAIVFKHRHARVEESRSTAVQQTFRSAAGATEPLISMPFAYDSGLQDVATSCATTVKTRTAAALAEVWALGETLTLGGGEVRSLTARQSDGTPFTAAVAPTTGGDDYTVVSGSVTSATLDRTSGAEATITITAGAAGASITGLRLRAQSVDVTNTITVTNTLATTATEGRPYHLPIIPEISVGTAQDFCNAVVGYYDGGRTKAVLTIRANGADARMTAALSLEISDRVRVIEGATGIDEQFHVDRIEHVIRPAAQHTTVLYLRRTTDAMPWVWDTSTWTGTDVWWF